MFDFISNFLVDVGNLPTLLLLLITFGLAFAETALFADVVVPGETGMILIGAAVGKTGGTALWQLIVVAAVGATLGDSLSWLIGRRFGRPLLCRWEPVRKRLEPEIGRAERLFAERGGGAVFIGRFIGPLRAAVPATAGLSGMPFRRFLPWNVAASAVWTSTVIVLGWILGRQTGSAVGQVVGIVGWVVVAALIGWWLKNRLQRNREEHGDSDEPGPCDEEPGEVEASASRR